jgi:hypothetical protein
VTFQNAEYLLVSLEVDPDLLVGVVEDPGSTLDSSARNACGTSKACAYLHTIMAYVPCAQLRTKTMTGAPGSCGLLGDPTDLLAASQTPANPVNIYTAALNSLILHYPLHTDVTTEIKYVISRISIYKHLLTAQYSQSLTNKK